MTAIFCAFSGGIDSTALALTFPEAIPVFTDTGDEFDHVYAHLEKFEQVTGRQVVRIRAAETLPEYEVRAKFLPNHGARFCTRMFKIEPMNRWLRGEDKPAVDWHDAARLIYGHAPWLSRPEDEWDQAVIALCQRTADEMNLKRARLPAELWIGLRADEPADVRVGNLTDMPGLTIGYPLRDAGFDRSMCIRVCLANDLLPRNPPYAVRGGVQGLFLQAEV